MIRGPEEPFLTTETLRREATGLPLRLAAVAGIAAVATLCLLIGMNYGGPFRLAVGSGEDRYIQGWRADDEVLTEVGARRYFRWVLDRGRLRLPIISYGAEYRVRVHAHRHEPGTVSVIANFEEVFSESLQPTPWRDYSFTIPAAVAGRGPLSFVFLCSPTPEDLVLAVDWIEVARGDAGWVLPPPGLVAAYLAALLFLGLTARRLGGSTFATLVVIVAIVAATAGLYVWKLVAITVISRMWPLMLFLWLVSAGVKSLASGLAPGRVYLIGMCVHAVMYFHPYLYPPDLHYHFRFAEKLTHLSMADIYRVSVMYDIPGNFSLNYPYSPVFHLITGVLTPTDADLKYAEKLIVLIAYGSAAVCLWFVSRRLGLGSLPLLLYFLDPTLMRHLYRCHMPGMFGISATSIMLLLLSLTPLTRLSRTRLALTAGLFAFAMCTYPASFLQISMFLGLLVGMLAVSQHLRSELPRLVLVSSLAYGTAMLLFYGHYLHLIWKFFLASRTQVVAAGRVASATGTLAIWWETISLEKAWPFYIPAIAGMIWMWRRESEPRWRAIQLAWALTFVAQMILTSDYLLPSVRVHIKEMAFFTPVLLLWQSEALIHFAAGRTWRKITCAAFVALLIGLSVGKMAELVRLGFAMP